MVLMDVAITEASVERSFSVHKALHTAKRHSLENAGAQIFLSSNPRVPQVSQFRAATPIPDSELVVDVYAEMLTPDPPLEKGRTVCFAAVEEGGRRVFYGTIVDHDKAKKKFTVSEPNGTRIAFEPRGRHRDWWFTD